MLCNINTMSSENYRSATKSHDPGWNDPPKLSYSPGVAAGSGQTTKLNLNKRIAFPVTKTDPPSIQAPPPTVGGSSTLPQFVPAASTGNAKPLTSIPTNRPMPPLPPMGPAGTPPRIDKPIADSTGKGPIDFPADEEMRDLVKNTLEEFLQRTDNNRQTEIRKRLDVMLQAWTEAKLSDGLIKKLYRLAQALTQKKAVDANEIHRSIIVEHGKECVQWAPALRQLVQVVPKQEETPANLEAKEPVMNPL